MSGRVDAEALAAAVYLGMRVAGDKAAETEAAINALAEERDAAERARDELAGALEKSERARDEWKAAAEAMREALDAAQKGCGSALFVSNNEHNYKAAGDTAHGFIVSMGVDAQAGYDAATAALAATREEER